MVLAQELEDAISKKRVIKNRNWLNLVFFRLFMKKKEKYILSARTRRNYWKI